MPFEMQVALKVALAERYCSSLVMVSTSVGRIFRCCSFSKGLERFYLGLLILLLSPMIAKEYDVHDKSVC